MLGRLCFVYGEAEKKFSFSFVAKIKSFGLIARNLKIHAKSQRSARKQQDMFLRKSAQHRS